MIHDALIVGGGPAGATAARILARAGWSVLVVEKKKFPRRKVCGEFISATSLPLLQAGGIGPAFAAAAGPEVRRVAMFVGEHRTTADMPKSVNGTGAWGRALGRETLDALLLQSARDAGADIRQPLSAERVIRDGDHFICEVERDGTIERLLARVVIVAHGSWERSITGERHGARRPSDLFAFKAHFFGSDLDPDLMPLIAFPGGYGGMVHSDQGRVSLSCCIRRDVMERCRHEARARTAGETVLQHIERSCAGVRVALAQAEVTGSWMSAGPIRPGIRRFHDSGIFFAGNAAAEAHPIIAEGISMAVQSGSLLAEKLIARKAELMSGRTSGAAAAYELEWRRRFALRLRASAALAHLAMRRPTSLAMAQTVSAFPSLLTWGARISGKTADHNPRVDFAHLESIK